MLIIIRISAKERLGLSELINWLDIKHFIISDKKSSKPHG